MHNCDGLRPFLCGRLPTSYDSYVPSPAPESSRSRELLPGGVFATRRAIRRRGGITAIGCAVALWLLGKVLSYVFSGPMGGVFSFVFTVMAVPALPMFGVPAGGTDNTVLIAIAVSASAWWFIGQMASGRVTKKPVVGWREWLREFFTVGIALWCGAAGGLLLGALLLGAW